MFGMGATELLILLAIVLLLFGHKRLRTLGADLGTSIKGFRDAVKEDASEGSATHAPIEDRRTTPAVEGGRQREHKPYA